MQAWRTTRRRAVKRRLCCVAEAPHTSFPPCSACCMILPVTPVYASRPILGLSIPQRYAGSNSIKCKATASSDSAGAHRCGHHADYGARWLWPWGLSSACDGTPDCLSCMQVVIECGIDVITLAVVSRQELRSKIGMLATGQGLRYCT